MNMTQVHGVAEALSGSEGLSAVLRRASPLPTLLKWRPLRVAAKSPAWPSCAAWATSWISAFNHIKFCKRPAEPLFYRH
jgi:hypothetical protein